EGNTNLSNINLTSSGDFDVNFSNDIINSLNAGDSEEITVTLLDDIDDLELGENKIRVTAETNYEGENIEDKTNLFYDKSFSQDDNEGELSLERLEIGVDNGFGKDEEWYPLDEIELDFMVENNGDWDIDDIEIEACLFDVKENKCIMNERDMEIDYNDFDLREGRRQNVLIDFKIEPDLLYWESEEYRIYIKATGEIDDLDSEYDEDLTGTSLYEEVEILQEEFIAIDDLRVSSPTEQESYDCGSELQIKGDVWNIGDEEIDSDDAYLRIYNSDLEINEVIDLEDINALDHLPLDFILEIPEELDEKIYYLDFVVYDDEDMNDNDIYELDNENKDEAIYTLPLEIKGSCSIPEIEISETSLVSGKIAGETFKIKTTILNTGEDTTQYNLMASDYSEWASSAQFSDQIITLESGESKEIQMELKSNEDISGEKTFNLEIYSGNELIKEQPIQVSVEENKSFLNISQINLVNILIIAIGVLLIVIILVLLVKLSKKKKG
ncbi:MAG: putative S-layer protein, partial [Candidatus Woesearchaeota archaeon]